MPPRHFLTLQTQLGLPLIPFGIDLFTRAVFLGASLRWYQIPDLWTLLVTYAFFCLGLMATINPLRLPTDPDANVHVESARQELLGYAIFAVAFAGGISFFRSFNETYPEHHVSAEHGLALFVTVAIFVGYTFIRICRTHLSYANRDS
jgi:hypothetical protein